MAEADPLKGSQCRFESDRGYVDPIFATTPEPPYTAVVFTSIRTDGDGGYGAMSDAMTELAAPAARRDEIAQSRGRER